MGTQSKYIWMDGRLVEFEKATIHFLNPTLHYGMGVFEGIRAYSTPNGTAVFRLRDHIERLFDSARVFGMHDFPYTVDEIIAATKETVAANEFPECYIRPLIYYQSGSMALNSDATGLAFGIAVWEWNSYLGAEAIAQGIRANISSFTRGHLNSTMTKAKITGNYPNSVMAKTESVRLGFDEAIMLDAQGYVAECTGENLFIVRGGKIITPPMAPILEGITRDSLIQLARGMGYEIVEGPISRDQLYIADEMFVCGTAAELIAIRELDFRTIGEGRMGPVTHRLQRAYHDAIHGRHPLSAQWLEYVAERQPAPAD